MRLNIYHFGLNIKKEAGTRFIGKYSIKAALDIDYSDIQEKNKAINILLQDVAAIRHWLSKQPVSLTENQYLKETLSLLETVLSQNIEPDPDGGSKIIDGVAPDRRISITDSDMRHGRKSSSRTGRTIAIHDQEAMLQTLKYYVETPEGRKEARERLKVEHVLVSICNRKGARARYAGLRLNEYDLNRIAMVTNLHIALNLAA